jgi:hypothetical protein
VETTSAIFLGATLGCARCHNHKYDPFSQKEFYQVFPISTMFLSWAGHEVRQLAADGASTNTRAASQTG